MQLTDVIAASIGIGLLLTLVSVVRFRRRCEIDDDEVISNRCSGGKELGHGPHGIEPVSGAIERVAQELLEAHAVLDEQESHFIPH